ncbi:PAS domain S-box protein [Algibacter sp. PT7-4]|uniref:PAS domain S-box protein n=1 Tax=Algibacter ulvanivorans TaxID=3400999 RepID=UPI003AAB43BC
MRALEAKQDYNVELRFLSNNGKVTWVSVSAVRTYDANNELDGYIGMCLDISQQKMTEQSLIKSESLFRRLTSEAPVAIYQADKDGNCNYVNKEWIRYTGQNFEEALGVGWLDVIHPDDKQKTLKEWKSLVKSGHDFSFVFRHLGSNGNVSWISSKAVRTYDANNLFNGFIGISVDITDSKKAEEIEIKNKQYLNNIINNIGDPVFVKDDQSRMILVNNALCDIFNLTRENILGKTLAENVPPEERERFLQNDKQVIKTGIESITEETVSLNKAETRTISTKKTRFIDNNGNKFIIGVIRDITETKKAEEKIKESEQYLDNIINNIGDPVFVKDHQSQIILANDAFCSILGVNRNEIIGKTLAENVQPEERESFLSIDREVISSGKENVNEENFTFSKNETRIISTKKTRFVDNKGNRFLIGVIRDITEQKKVSEEIRKAHQRITTHLNNSPLAIIEWDKNLIIRNWSAKAKSIFGWDEHEVIGKHFSDINLIYKEDAESTKIICDELMSGKVKSNRSVNRNNTKLKKVIYCDWYNSVLLSKDGEIETIFSLVQDITTRIETEKIIKESEEKFSKVFQSNIIGFSIVNSDQIRVDVNETMAKMLETTKKHLIGKTLEEAQIEILDDTYYEQKKILSEKIVEKGFLSNETVSRTLISGKKIVTLVSVEPLEVNGSLHLLTAAIDITDKKQAELELENYRNKLEELVELRTAELEKEKIKAQSADLMKSAFLATMSHELRTPMNSIIGFTGILLKEFAGPLNEEQKKQLGMVKNSSQHLLGLINDVLDISKIEAGKLKISLSPFNYLTTLEKTIDFILPQATKKGLTINTEIAAVNITLNSDERRVEQVLLNLLSNAIKFSNKGNVLVKVNIENNFVVTQVIDQGIGISKKDIDKLFIPFVQLDGGLNRVHEGSGLGLSICKNLLEKLGGSIQVESKKDKGSNFMFKIPI